MSISVDHVNRRVDLGLRCESLRAWLRQCVGMDVEGEWDSAEVGEVPVRSSAEEVLAGLHSALCCSRYCSLPHPAHAFGQPNCIMPTCTEHLLRACPHEVPGSKVVCGGSSPGTQWLPGGICAALCILVSRTCLGANSAF